MKTITINGTEIKYTGTFTDIEIHEPKDLSFSEECEMIAQIQCEKYKQSKEKYNKLTE